MRIAIITQPLGRNYGGILQNFALQYVLREMGHNPVTINTGRYTTFDWLKGVAKFLIKRILGRQSSMPESPKSINSRISGLNEFVIGNIHLTRKVRSCSCKLLREYGIEAIIVGSDQVWRPCYSNLDEAFLEFASRIDIKRLAYAASFGTSEWEYSDKQTQKYKSLVSLFESISVREDCAVRLCERFLGVSAIQVLDPTLLVSRDVYCSLAENSFEEKDYVLVYLLDTCAGQDQMIQNVASSMHLDVKYSRGESFIESTDTIEKWLYDFNNASFIITDSFHGTAFSIIFNRDFIVLPNNQRGNARIESLLRLFTLEDRLIKTNSDFSFSKISWDEVNSQRERLIIESLSYLKEHLHS